MRHNKIGERCLPDDEPFLLSAVLQVGDLVKGGVEVEDLSLAGAKKTALQSKKSRKMNKKFDNRVLMV